MRKKGAVVPFALLSAVALSVGAAESIHTLRGYSSQSSATEVEWERKFRKIPEPERLRENMRRLSARPHHVGSPYDKDNAEWIVAQMKSWGLDARIETFDTLFPTPKERVMELVAPVKYTAKLQEPALAIDPTSNQKSEQLPTYNAYSIDGDVTAPVVYVNYGSPADYEQLERMGVSVSGAIVLARYGLTWRGIKPKVAAEHGAIGCLIYSDPHEDGYRHGDIYPNGPMRPPFGVQRGSVMDMPVYPGDPQTPGVGATPDAKKLPMSEVKTLTKIPVMPISYEDAEPLLKNLSGELVPEAWRGGLPLTYHVGPGPAKVHLRLQFNFDRKPLYDVIVKIPGSKYPDQWVIRGNHHDGWVNGAGDPVSGASPEMEEARGLAELLKQGWKPDRTIIYCFWDGEEPGLLGSTEWAETHAEELKQHAVAYINSDGNGRGFFRAEGSHSLENFTNGVMKDIEDPETKMTVWKRARLAGISKGAGDRKAELKARPDLRIGALGSGSDYTVFIDHLGVASLNIGYGGEDAGGGQYHSIYDDFYWYTHFEDTDFAYGKALAQTGGTIMMRLADCDVLPFQFTNLADTIHTYLGELKKLSIDQRAAIKERNSEIEDGVYVALADPKKKMVPPGKEPLPPYLNFAPLENASDELTRAAAGYEAALTSAGGQASASVNAKLLRSERVLTDSEGLPNRPWFENLIYAPGFYTGYGVKTIPGVREAIEQKRWIEVDHQIARVAKALQSEADLLDEAAKELGGK
ncbi:MAG TPA: transferrin receptor-like dimerization domain-containing protein [Bryobacteraceae bacterium]|nr:transferrin receptor-like dimerization domain-containing protein [Bryobacteraceae bacterium]